MALVMPNLMYDLPSKNEIQPGKCVAFFMQCQWGGILQGCCADSRYAQTSTDVAVACCDVERSANCSEYEIYVVGMQ